MSHMAYQKKEHYILHLHSKFQSDCLLLAEVTAEKPDFQEKIGQTQPGWHSKTVYCKFIRLACI